MVKLSEEQTKYLWGMVVLLPFLQ